jgi:hypothetical protein
MAPATTALMNGLKPVFAPIPIFFDRKWSGESLQKYFNPSPLGESGSSPNSPFSSKNENRFKGSTWGPEATPPKQLYDNFLGRAEDGVGGLEVCFSARVILMVWY